MANQDQISKVRSAIARNRQNFVLRLGAAICRKYLHAYNNEFNWGILHNGESFIVDLITRNEPGVVLDVGANIGAYALMCAELPSVTTVHAFEISPETFETLNRNCSPNPKVICNPFGLSDHNGTTDIYYSPESNDRTSMHPIQHGFDTQRRAARVQTGDEYVGMAGIGRVSFLKIDVEGADLQTLRGFERTLAHGRIGGIQFEHGQPSVESRTFLRDIVAFLEKFNFCCFALYPTSLEPVTTYGYDMEDFRGRNYVALSPQLAPALEPVIVRSRRYARSKPDDLAAPLSGPPRFQGAGLRGQY